MRTLHTLLQSSGCSMSLVRLLPLHLLIGMITHTAIAHSSLYDLCGRDNSTPTSNDYEAYALAQQTCVNGDCYVSGGVARCACGELYYGPRCEHVNIHAAQLIVIGNMVIFKWPLPPRLRGYSFLYYRLQDSIQDVPRISRRTIRLSELENYLLVGNLRGGLWSYRVCVVLDVEAEIAVSLQHHELLTLPLVTENANTNQYNCRDVHTNWDYHSLAGWLLAIIFAAVAVALIYLQKDKIELLYFHKPWILNNGYNYNVQELIRIERERKEREMRAENEGDIVAKVATGSSVIMAPSRVAPSGTGGVMGNGRGTRGEDCVMVDVSGDGEGKFNILETITDE